jgi:hypothetical protein
MFTAVAAIVGSDISPTYVACATFAFWNQNVFYLSHTNAATLSR